MCFLPLSWYAGLDEHCKKQNGESVFFSTEGVRLSLLFKKNTFEFETKWNWNNDSSMVICIQNMMVPKRGNCLLNESQKGPQPVSTSVAKSILLQPVFACDLRMQMQGCVPTNGCLCKIIGHVFANWALSVFFSKPHWFIVTSWTCKCVGKGQKPTCCTHNPSRVLSSTCPSVLVERRALSQSRSGPCRAGDASCRKVQNFLAWQQDCPLRRSLERCSSPHLLQSQQHWAEICTPPLLVA